MLIEDNDQHKNLSKNLQSPRLPPLQFNRKIKYTQTNNPQKQFNLRTTNLKLPPYNPLADRHLRLFFGQETVQKHLKKLSVPDNSPKMLTLEDAYEQKYKKNRQVTRSELLQYMNKVRLKVQNKNKNTLI